VAGIFTIYGIVIDVIGDSTWLCESACWSFGQYDHCLDLGGGEFEYFKYVAIVSRTGAHEFLARVMAYACGGGRLDYTVFLVAFEGQ
jgi:hypothetical protein